MEASARPSKEKTESVDEKGKKTIMQEMTKSLVESGCKLPVENLQLFAKS